MGPQGPRATFKTFDSLENALPWRTLKRPEKLPLWPEVSAKPWKCDGINHTKDTITQDYFCPPLLWPPFSASLFWSPIFRTIELT